METPLKFLVGLLRFHRSYPTYEEWKPSPSIFIALKNSSSSYPTYEEWKLYKSEGNTMGDLFVLILPMRNGN